MAETTTTTSCPARLVATMRAATRRTLVASATDDPPYFWTMRAMVGILLGRRAGAAAFRRPILIAAGDCYPGHAPASARRT